MEREIHATGMGGRCWGSERDISLEIEGEEREIHATETGGRCWGSDKDFYVENEKEE